MKDRIIGIAIWGGWSLIIGVIALLGVVAYPQCQTYPPGFSCDGEMCRQVGYSWKPAQMLDNAVYWAVPETRIRRICLGRNPLGMPCDLKYFPHLPE